MPFQLVSRRLRFYQTLCNLTLCVILAELAFILIIGLRPIDTGGTLMGGAYGQLLMLVIWCSITLGLLFCSLARLPRHWQDSAIGVGILAGGQIFAGWGLKGALALATVFTIPAILLVVRTLIAQRRTAPQTD